jgi:F1F0 ATPase subunit 2
MMSDGIRLIPALLAGVSLGVIFYGGLWWTVRRGVLSKHAAVWFFCSLLLRTGIALAGFYLIAHGHPERLLMSLLGFVMARLIVTKLAGPSVEHHKLPAKEAGHASQSR